MPAISVGSVEVDVVPNAQGIRARLQAAVVPAADEVGEEVGRIIGRHISTQVAAAIRDGVTTGGRTAQAPAARQGQSTGSTFARSLRTTLAAALRDLPEVRLTANSTDAQREIYEIRNRLRTLQDLRIGIDLSSADAVAAINHLQERLQRLSASDADVAIRVDAASAASQLAAIQAQVNRLDGETARVDVDTSAGVSGMQALITAAIAFGPAIIPALPVVAAGLGAIAAAATAAGAGIGAVALVAAPAFKGISTALQAQKAAQDAATNSSLRGSQVGAQAARQGMQQASAQQALASARRNAARQIADAERGVGDAARQAAQANARAAQQVKAARQAVADAYLQAADRMQQANRQVVSAERDLTQAQKGARQAQLDLVSARKEAADQLEDLNTRLTNSQLSQRDAEIALKEATLERDKVLKDAKATDLDKERALLQYDQAVQRLKEQQTETKRLTADTKAANKAGVEGSDTVKSAQERLAGAQQNVVDKTAALKAAQQNVAKTQIENTRAIAEAQSKLADAQKNVAETQRQGAEAIARAQERVVRAQQSGADSIASAQRQIASASIQAAGGVDQAAIAQAKYQQALSALSPSARETFNAFTRLSGAFKTWSTSLQPHVMPIFTRALDGMRRSLPALTPFVKEAAGAITELQDRASRGFKSPWWQTFKKDLAGSVRPAIVGLGVAFGNVFKGMAGIIGAFLPHMDSISSRMQSITERFANWGQSLKGSPEFERFLSYSSEMAPKLGDALGKVAGAVLSIGQALSPVSGPLLFLLGGLAEAIGIVAEHAPWLVQGIWLVVVAMRVWTLAQWALNAAMSANPITLWIIGITALIAVGVWAFNKFPWFRDLVLAAWNGIKTASLWLWNNALRPFFAWFGAVVVWLWQKIIKPYIGFVIAYWRTVAQVAMWLWKNILSPVFQGIGAVIAWWWNSIVKRYFALVKAIFLANAAVTKWLYDKTIKPVFNAIGLVISWWWTQVVKRYFGYVRGAITVLADAFKWLWQKGAKPAWNGIAAVIASVWRVGIKPVFDGLKLAVRRVAESFDSSRGMIKTAWDKLRKIARDPIKYVVDVVYNQGIRGVWNKIAGAFGAKKLDRFTFASGGIMPGYTPGKDVHRFVSPTGGQLELSGGEAIMRPEFTRVVGSGFVGAMNSIAKSRGAQGVKAALAPVFGGNPMTPTDTSLRYAGGGVVQRFADGGIFGWIKSAGSALKGAGSAAWNSVKEGARWLADTLEGSARAGVKNVVDPLLRSFPGMDTGFGQMVRKIPTRIVDTLFGYSKKADDKGAGGIGGPRIQAALKWARTQNGLPYQWGGDGNPSWDCSGLVSAAESVIRGQKPHRRWATGAFSGKTAPPGWVYHGNSAFKIGITNAGVGHTAGTLGKVNIESRGGDGVVIGRGARGYRDKLFNSWYGFMPGKYDSGGYLQPGLNLAYNGTGRPEPVFTTAQANALTAMAARGSSGGVGDLSVTVYVGNREITDIARAEVRTVQGELIQVLNAS